jgi:hypothetical protein
VIYGPPDEIENKVGIPERGAVVPLEPPCDNISRQGGCYEVWRYHNIAGVNHPVTINFADVCEDGELIPLVDRADAERLSRPPAPKYKDPCGRDYVPTTLPNGIQLIDCLGHPPPRCDSKTSRKSRHIRFNILSCHSRSEPASK